jgi:Acetoacetate decarboxylase (ADC)
MLCHLSKQQMERLSAVPVVHDFHHAEMLVATFKTDAARAAEILPRPLSPAGDGLATVFVARYPQTNFGCVYNEGALFIHCTFRREKGLYCLSMPVDDDMALIGGREQFGYPKKMADRITLKAESDSVTGSVVRKGNEILRIDCELGDEVDEGSMRELGEPVVDWNGAPGYKVLAFLFKHFLSPGGAGFDYFPRLIREPVLFRTEGAIRAGSGRVRLNSTPVDPLAEVLVGDMVSMFYGLWNNSMLPGKVVSRAWNPLAFAPHAFFKLDMVPFFLKTVDPKDARRAKEIARAAKKL